MAGFGPGLMLTLLFALCVVFKYRLERTAALKVVTAGGTSAAILEDEHFTWTDRLESLPRFLPFLVLIVVIMVAMYDGWATPSEVAGIGARGLDRAGRGRSTGATARPTSARSCRGPFARAR